MYLADTNIISELMRPVPHAGVVRWVEALDQTAGFAVSVVSVDEILFGLTQKPRPRALELFNGLAARITVLDVTEACWQLAARCAARPTCSSPPQPKSTLSRWSRAMCATLMGVALQCSILFRHDTVPVDIKP